jgi:hypothetical protein
MKSLIFIVSTDALGKRGFIFIALGKERNNWKLRKTGNQGDQIGQIFAYYLGQFFVN